MKKIAIMQPYFFPYIGYFELINKVDEFVFLTDVQYVKRSWITRNKIKSHNKEFDLIKIDIKKHSQKTNINQIEILDNKWKELFFNKILHTYGKKSLSHPLMNFIEKLEHKLLKDFLCNSIMWISKYLNLNVNFIESENLSKKTKQDKIIEICKKCNCETYVNAFNGKNLYSTEEFKKNSINLEFMELTTYENKFSIVDLILTEEDKIKKWLKR